VYPLGKRRGRRGLLGVSVGFRKLVESPQAVGQFGCAVITACSSKSGGRPGCGERRDQSIGPRGGGLEKVIDGEKHNSS